MWSHQVRKRLNTSWDAYMPGVNVKLKHMCIKCYHIIAQPADVKRMKANYQEDVLPHFAVCLKICWVNGCATYRWPANTVALSGC